MSEKPISAGMTHSYRYNHPPGYKDLPCRILYRHRRTGCIPIEFQNKVRVNCPRWGVRRIKP